MQGYGQRRPDKKTRREQIKMQRKMQKKIRQGSKVTVRDRNGNIRTIDGKEEMLRQERHKKMQQTRQWGKWIIPVQMILWWAYKLLSSEALPGQLCVLCLLLSIPLVIAVIILLSVLAPRIRNKKEGGGTLYAAMVHLVLTMEMTTAVLWVTGADQSSAYMQTEDQFYGRGVIFTFTTVVVGLIPYFLGFAIIGIFLTVAINNLETSQWYDMSIKADIGLTAAFVVLKAAFFIRAQMAPVMDVVEVVADASSG